MSSLTWVTREHANSQTESRRAGPGAGGGEMGISVYWAQSFRFGNEKVLEMDGDGGCIKCECT